MIYLYFYLNSDSYMTRIGGIVYTSGLQMNLECQLLNLTVLVFPLTLCLVVVCLRWFIDIPQVWKPLLVGLSWLTTDKLLPSWWHQPPYGSISIIWFWCTSARWARRLYRLFWALWVSLRLWGSIQVSAPLTLVLNALTTGTQSHFLFINS